jgi:hypothetical protein
VHALGRAIEDDVLHGFRGHRHDRQIDVIGNVADPGVRRQARHGGGAGVHGVHPTGEVAGDQVAHQCLSDGVLTPTGSDDRDGARVEERIDRGRLGPVLPAAHQADRVVGRVDRELHNDKPVLQSTGHDVAGLTEGLQHAVVVGEDLGDEAFDPALTPGLSEMLQQHVGDATSLVAVLDQERDLGLAGADPVVAADGDQLTGHQHHQRHPVHVVDLGESAQVAGGEFGHRGEEPVVLRVVGDPGVELHHQGDVLGPHRAQVGGPAIAQHHVRGPVGWRHGTTDPSGLSFGGHLAKSILPPRCPAWPRSSRW